MILEKDESANSVKVVVASDLKSVDEVVAVLMKFVVRHFINIDLFGFELVLREGLNNAVIHGNQYNSGLETCCEVEFDDKRLYVKIKDEGAGFAWQDKVRTSGDRVDDPEAVSGRGLFLMKEYGYEVAFNSIGNCLIISTALPNAPVR